MLYKKAQRKHEEDTEEQGLGTTIDGVYLTREQFEKYKMRKDQEYLDHLMLNQRVNHGYKQKRHKQTLIHHIAKLNAFDQDYKKTKQAKDFRRYINKHLNL